MFVSQKKIAVRKHQVFLHLIHFLTNQGVKKHPKWQMRCKTHFTAPSIPLVREGGSRRQSMRESGVSGVGVWAWASPAGMGTAWWAETSRRIVRSRRADRPAAPSRCLRSGSRLRPDPLPLRCPARHKDRPRSINTRFS